MTNTLIEIAAAITQRRQRYLMRYHSLTGHKFAVLSLVYEAPGREITVREVLSRLRLAPSTVSHIARDLEDRLFLTREPDPQDKRKMTLRLTTQGARTVDTIRAGLNRQEEQLNQALAPASDVLIALAKLLGVA